VRSNLVGRQEVNVPQTMIDHAGTIDRREGFYPHL
jgi:hypothetical protein